MSKSDPNTLRLRPTGGGPEDLDVLLRDFFQAEMPQPWPALRAPVSTSARPTPRWSSMRSRLALAASVGLLMIGSWAMSARLPEYGAVHVDPAPNGIGSANGRERMPKPGKVTPGAPVKNGAPTK